MFNSSRLTLARKRVRLTARELSELAGLTPVHLSRLEKGKAENVESTTVAAIARALGYPIDFFYGDDIESPQKETSSFRSLSAMSAKERDSALSAGAIAYLLADWVGKRFNLPEVDLPDLRFEKEPDAAARALRSYWGLGEQPIGNAIQLLESKGVRVFSLAEDTHNVDAFSCWRDNVPYIFLNTGKSAERSRFDAFHELGHLVLHRHGKSQGRPAESEADKFSSHFLIAPMDLVGNISFVSSLEQIIHLKKRWGVSAAALSYRLHKDGLITDWQYRTFCIHLRKKYGTKEPQEMDREGSVLWEKVFRELWKDKMTKDHVAKELSVPSHEIDALIFNLVGN